MNTAISHEVGSNLVTPASLSMYSSIATQQSSFNQLLALTSSTNSNSTNVNSENVVSSTTENQASKQVDIMAMLNKAQVQYNSNSHMAKGILEPPTSHSTPGSLSTLSLVGTQECANSLTSGEPKPISQWPHHEIFLNSNQFIKPEPVRRVNAGAGGLNALENGQQQSNNSLNTSSIGGLTCSPPSSTSSSTSGSSSSCQSSSSAVSKAASNPKQPKSNNALLNLLLSSSGASNVNTEKVDNKMDTPIFSNNG